MFFLIEFGYHHSVARAYDEYVINEFQVNTSENAWSLFKRGLIGMYHHVSAKYLQKYLGEFVFGYLTLLDDFRTFKWPRASDLQELIVGSRV